MTATILELQPSGRHREGEAPDPVAVPHGRIARMSGPMVLSSAVGVAVQIAVLGLIGHMGGSALYVRAVYAPVAYLFIALTTGLAVTLQVAVAQACGRGERESISAHLGSVARAGVLVFALVGGTLVATAGPLASAVGVTAAARGPFHTFLAAMTGATLLGTIGEMMAGVLRGAGRAGVSSAITATYVGVNLSIVGTAVARHDGLMSVPFGLAAGGLVEIGLGLAVLVRLGLVDPGRLRAWRPGTWHRLLSIGLPVGISSIVLAVVNLLLLHIVEPAGVQAVAGFTVGYQLMAAVLVPAIGLGSAVAVLMNQTLTAHGLSSARTVFRRGLTFALSIYATATVAILVAGAPLADVMTANPEATAQAHHFLHVVGPTFGCTAISLVTLTILEQVGYGLIAVFMNVCYFAVIIVVGWALVASHHHDVHYLYVTMAVTAVVSLFAGLPISIPAALRPRILKH